MKRSIVLLAVTAAFGLSACTSTPEATPTSAATPDPTGGATVVTEVVTQTVTKEAPPPTKPVMDSFGYGPLKLGMTLQQALDTKMIGSARLGGQPADLCTVHDILGTDQAVSISKKIGVANIYFTAAMTSDGVGIGGTEAALKAKYTDLVERHGGDSWTVSAPGNPKAKFDFSGSPQDVLDGSQLRHVDQDCHS